MAYADQQMSGSRVVAIIIVALIHVVIGYTLVTGLAYSAAKSLVERVTTVDINEPPPPPEDEPPPPPPEPDTAPPPPVAPPPPINVATTPPQVQTQTTIPPQAPPAPIIPPAAPPGPPPPPPPPPPPSVPPKAASPRGNAGSWATNDDYPSGALRREEQGTTGVRLSVGADGRVTGCDVTSSSGSKELDDTTCRLLQRRGRFNAATANGEPVAGSWSTSIRWQIPD